MNKNWVTEILDDVAKTVASWPDWMRRPEVQMPVPEQPALVVKASSQGNGSVTHYDDVAK
jgi:hypothetical protein